MTNLVWGASRRILDDDGDPHSGGKIYVYAAGTTTASTTYSDSALTSANAHPVVADANGIVGPIFVSSEGLYKVRVTDASDVILYEDDNVTPTASDAYSQPEAFGAIGDGSTDDGAALQAWLDYLCANPGTVGLLRHRYKTKQDLTVNKPVHIEGSWWGSDTDLAAQPDDPHSAIIAGTGVTDLLTCQSDTLTYRLWGVTIRGVYFEGSNIAERLLVMNSCDRFVINAAGERATVCGLDLTEANDNNCRFGEIESWIYQGGSAAASRAGHGFRMEGTNSWGITNITIHHMHISVTPKQFSSVTDSGGAALFTFGSAHGFEVGDTVIVYDNEEYAEFCEWVTVATVPSTTTLTLTGVNYSANATFGWMSAAVGAWIGDSDSSWFGRYQSQSIYFAGERQGESPQRRAARKHTFGHIAAHILMGTEARIYAGNVNSETSSVTVYGAKEATLAGNVIDRTTGRNFRWHQFQMTDQVMLPASAGAAVSATQVSLGGAPFQVWNLVDASTSSLDWVIPPPSDWYDGKITKVQIWYTGAATASGIAKMNARLDLMIVDTSGVGNWDQETAFDMASPAVVNVATMHEQSLSDFTYTQGGILHFSLQRLGGDAGDTHNAALYIYGVKLFYESDGPVNGTWMKPAFEF